MDEAEKRNLDVDLCSTAWLHDIGKPVVARPWYEEDGQSVRKNSQGNSYHLFKGHAEKGAEMIRGLENNLFHKVGARQERVAKLTQFHDLPMKGIKRMRKSQDYRNFLSQYEEMKQQLYNLGVCPRDLLTFFLIDKIGSGLYYEDEKELFLTRSILMGGVPESRLKEVYELQRD